MPADQSRPAPATIADIERLSLWTAAAGGTLLTAAPEPDPAPATADELIRAEARIVAAAANREVGLLVTGLMAAGVMAVTAQSDAEVEDILRKYTPTPDGAFDILTEWNRGGRSMADLNAVCRAAADYASEYMAVLGMAILALQKEGLPGETD